ncbi:MAG TPA: hypothetical protein VKA21_03030 [Candidatus Binatia bacterium]|nr:hypothetical protein [Candidatus Binatia bacterium]
MRTLRGFFLVLLLAPRPAAAALVTITDCVSDPHIVVNVGNGSTRIEIPGDDLVLACGLSPLSGTDRVVIIAHDVTIDGPAGGITASSDAKAIDITASGTFTARDTAIESTGNNGSMEIASTGDMLFERTIVDLGGSTSGDDMRIHCDGAAPDCTLTARDTTFESRLTYITAVGDITFSAVRLLSHSPRDYIRVISTHGDVLLGSQGLSGLACCGGGRRDPTIVLTGNEGNLLIEAFGLIDAKGANILVSEFITFTSGVGLGPALVPATIDITDASVRNDFAKQGEIVMTADENLSTITIANAILVDDDTAAGVDDVAELNTCEQVPRTLPPCLNIVGTPAIDD